MLTTLFKEWDNYVIIPDRLISNTVIYNSYDKNKHPETDITNFINMLHLIDTTDHMSLTFIRKLYEDSFPLSERRDWEQVIRLIPHSLMKLHLIRDNLVDIGFSITWSIGSWQYLEHLAIDRSLRGKQYGTLVMQLIIDSALQRLVLEVEPPADEISRKRIRFYERNGLILAPYAYSQPPYRKGGAPVPMRLMSMPAFGSQEEMSMVADIIQQTVYTPFWGQ